MEREKSGCDRAQMQKVCEKNKLNILAVKYVFTIFLSLCAVAGVSFAREIYVHAGSQVDGADGSEALPFRTIADALKVVEGGDTVIVREGLYRESVSVPGGEPNKPVLLKAAEGERAILSGAVPVTGWQKHVGDVYVTELDFKPERLLVNFRPQPIARHPNEGWWVAEDVNGLTIIDTVNLKTLEHDPVGGEAYIWTTFGNVFFTVPVASFDRDNGSFTVVRKSEWMELRAGDRYFLKNHPSLIDLPGEWAVKQENGKFLVYFQPVAIEDLNAVEVPYETRRILSIDKARHVGISGLEVVAAVNNGIEVNRSEDVIISGCISHSHGNRGILLNDVDSVTLRRNIILNNDHGVTLTRNRHVILEENEIARNAVDGLVVSWDSNDITVLRNYLHHHLLWGHPDNIQLFRGVKNIRFIDNLLIAGGQSIMMENTSEGLLKGNMIIGCAAYSVIFGHENSENYRIHNNTIAFSGYGCINFTARDYDVRENIFMTGHTSALFTVRGVEGYVGDRNLLYNASGLTSKTVVVSDKGWHRSFEEYRNATGYDLQSVYGDPMFRNAPVAYAVLDDKRITECSRSTLYLRSNAGPFRVGDAVEVDFDGVLRTVTNSSIAMITVWPELQVKPLKPSLICNWGQSHDLTLDLRLAADSPGVNLGASGGPVGSTIDIAAYQRGDFDADGKRDLPQIPPELEPQSNEGQETAMKINYVRTK